MPLIFLSENNSLSKKVLKNPFSKKDFSLFEIPFRKMRKRAIMEFKKKILKTDALFFSSPVLKDLLPERTADIKTFFNSFIADVLYSVAKSKNIESNRLVIACPTEDLTRSLLDLFPDIALAGEDALSVAVGVYESTGAAIPIVSGFSETDTVLCNKDFIPNIYGFRVGFDINSDEKSLGGDSFKFYPKGDYSSILALTHRPLFLEEAALLAEYDKKATFNIVF